MNEEKKIILRMLQEQKISMEEAEALLDAVEETDERVDEKAGATAEANTGGESSDRFDERTERTDTGGSGPEGSGRGGWFGGDFLNLNDLGKKISEGVKGIMKDVDLDRLKDDLKGIVESVKQELKDADFDGDLGAVMNRAFGKAKAEGERELTVQPEAFDTVEVDNTWGSITVGGSDDPLIMVGAKVTAWGEDEKAARALLDRIDIGTESDGRKLSIRPKVAGEEKTVRFKTDFTITVPKGLASILRTKTGDIAAEDLDSRVDTSSLSGNIVMARIDGPAVFRTKSGDARGTSLKGDVSVSLLSGDVHLEDVDGGIDCSTKSGDLFVRGGSGAIAANLLSGDIEIEERDGDLELRTKSGDIRLEAISGRLDCKTLSGDVRCRNVGIDALAASTMSGDLRVDARALSGGPVDLKSIDGDIELTLPADAGAVVTAETKGGSIATGFMALRDSISGNGKKLDGVLGAGGPEIRLSAVSGTVRIEPAG